MPHIRIKRHLLILLAAWTALMGGLLYWSIQRAHQETRTLAEGEAQALLSRENDFRLWLASHGGVYVPVDKNTPSNPNLAHVAERDIVSPSGTSLTLMNPAYAMRQMNERSSKPGGRRAHLTSLKPLRAGNAPDDWERAALESFERGETEVTKFTQVDDRPYLRILKPIITKKSCLKCHGHQGYQEGDVRGGIGVSLPMDYLLACQDKHIANLALVFGLIWAFGSIATCFGARRIGRHIRRELQAQEAMHESETRFHTLYEASSDAVMVLDETGFIDCNQATVQIFGCVSKEMFCGKHPSEFSPPTQPDGRDSMVAANEHITAALAEGSRHFEWNHQRRDGSVFSADVLLCRFSIAGDTLLQATVRDITQSKEDTERLRLAAEVASDLIFEWTPTTGSMQWFGDIDKALGFNEGELPRTFEAWMKQIHPEDQAVLERVMGHRATCTDEIREAYRIQRKDGSWRYWSGRAAPVLDESGRPTKWVGVCTDVTDKKRDEEELQGYAEALESANMALEQFNEAAESATRAKSAFLANMSHEIRTPMTAILGFTDVLLENLEQEEDISAATTVRRNGEYLLRLINDILDLSKIEAGKLDVDRSECSPVEVVADVASLMRVRADAKEIPLEIEWDGAIPRTIESDSIRLRQILINLIGNAIKFTDTGSVRLAIRMVESHDGPPCMQFDVIDTGIGLTDDQVSRLFQPFVQADLSTHKTFGGTGLGLAISRRLAEALGGTITINSRLGEGSTFTLVVETGDLAGVSMLDKPADAMPDQSISEESEPIAIQLDGRILLAEDGPDNQRLISHILKKAGAEVTVAENGRIAYERAMQAWEDDEPFDVVLMDMQMPDIDGYEATRRLREMGYTGPIIALTANAMAGDAEDCRAAGCDDYATKPLDRPKLLSMIARHFNLTQEKRVHTSPLE